MGKVTDVLASLIGAYLPEQLPAGMTGHMSSPRIRCR